MRRFEHTEETTATREALWERYADPPGWPEWDQETAEVTLDGAFTPGSTGSLRPATGPRVRFTLTDVSPPDGFTDVTRLPLARMTFTHRLEEVTGGTRITHTVTITGPLSPLFGRVIGAKVAAGLPEAMRRLARLAEQAPARA